MSDYEPQKGHHASTKMTTARIAIQLVIALGLAGAGVGAFRKIKEMRKKPPRKKPPKMVALVTTQELKFADHQAVLQAMGTVVAARAVDVHPQISGRIIALHRDLSVGSRLAANELVAEIEATDYELAVAIQKNKLAQAEADLALERGQQAVAKREWQMLKQVKDAGAASPLALREPQLKKAVLAVESAKTDLRTAELNLARTKIRVPFNSFVQTKSADLGSQVSAQSRLVTLVGTDEFWVEVTLPVDQLNWISIPGVNSEQGSPAKIYLGRSKNYREGKVLRLLAELEKGGRMARLLISVKNPLDSAKALPLLLDSFVRVEIQGKMISNVMKVPRYALRDGNRIWLCSAERTLVVRPVDVVWRSDLHVYLRDGVKEGEQLILSDLSTPVAGMQLQREGDKSAKKPTEEKQGRKQMATEKKQR